MLKLVPPKLSLVEAIAESIRNNSPRAVAQTVLEQLCAEFSQQIAEGKITREHMKMIVEEDTGVAASKLN